MNNFSQLSDFCCGSMYKSIKEKVIEYEMIDRTYCIPFRTNSIMVLSFCPWCGYKLKPSLHREFYEILEKEYGISIPDITNFSNLPEEFKTDEWWKKRGL